MATAASLETKEQILDVVEQAIAEYGYTGTTLRNVVSQAKVNLAAVSYHFGSKEGTEKFLDAFQRALPEQSRSQLKWKLDLVVASLVRVLGEAGKPGALLTGSTPDDIEETLAKLVSFVMPDLKNY